MARRLVVQESRRSCRYLDREIEEKIPKSGELINY